MSLKFKILVTISILVLTLNVFFLRLGAGHVGWRSVLTSIMSLQRSGRSRCVVDHNVVTSHIKVPCQQNNNEKWPISKSIIASRPSPFECPTFSSTSIPIIKLTKKFHFVCHVLSCEKFFLHLSGLSNFAPTSTCPPPKTPTHY